MSDGLPFVKWETTVGGRRRASLIENDLKPTTPLRKHGGVVYHNDPVWLPIAPEHLGRSLAELAALYPDTFVPEVA